MTRYFITVEWCNNGTRGLFCSKDGKAFFLDRPFTLAEKQEILGVFLLILSPESEPFTEKEIAEFDHFIPLAEYKNEYGIGLRSCDVPIRVGRD
jgi:hypothetical protein